MKKDKVVSWQDLEQKMEEAGKQLEALVKQVAELADSLEKRLPRPEIRPIIKRYN